MVIGFYQASIHPDGLMHFMALASQNRVRLRDCCMPSLLAAFAYTVPRGTLWKGDNGILEY